MDITRTNKPRKGVKRISIKGLTKFINVNDELEMQIDFARATLSYQTNGNGYHVAFRNIPKQKTRLALSLCPGFSVEVTSYQVTLN